jgi:hypothetical protein
MVLTQQISIQRTTTWSSMRVLRLCRYGLIMSCLMIISLTSAWGKKEIESYPLIGSVSSSVTWNHSNFVGTEKSASADQFNLAPSNGFGWSLLNINNALSYQWQFSPSLPPIFISSGIGFTRALSEGFNRAGVIPSSTTQPMRFYVQDMNLSAGWSIPNVAKLIPRLNVNLGVNGSIPFSMQSRALGVKTYLSSFISMIYATPIKIVIQSTAFVGYNVLENPTQQIDCSLTPQACQISGEDLGSPNDLMYWGGALNFQYPIFGGLRVGLTYRMFGSLLAISFPDTEDDPLASEYAQSGNQVGSLIHGTTLSFIYGFNRTASAAQEALNKSLGVDQEDEDSFLSRLSLFISMTTNDRLYAADGSRVTLPIFDFETDNRSRTTYTLSALITL